MATRAKAMAETLGTNQADEVKKQMLAQIRQFVKGLVLFIQFQYSIFNDYLTIKVLILQITAG